MSDATARVASLEQTLQARTKALSRVAATASKLQEKVWRLEDEVAALKARNRELEENQA